jgi:hypothetical protein
VRARSDGMCVAAKQTHCARIDDGDSGQSDVRLLGVPRVAVTCAARRQQEYHLCNADTDPAAFEKALALFNDDIAFVAWQQGV